MTPRWTTLLAVFLTMAIGAAVGLVGFQRAQAVWVHVQADHQAVHELAVLEMQRQRAKGATSAPAPAFDPAPPLTSSGK